MADTPVVAPPAPAAPVAPALNQAERVPCNWTLVPVEGEDQILATNNVTNKQFSGTVEEFNATFLRS